MENLPTYHCFDAEAVSLDTFRGQRIIVVNPESLTRLADEAFGTINHLFRASHLQQLRQIVEDKQTSHNDRYVALQQLKNAVTAAEGRLPACQDTGTATIYARKGAQIWSGGHDIAALEQGIVQAYHRLNLRYSQLAPLTLFTERNTGTNLPAQIDIEATAGEQYQFLFLAKGGGSANKTLLYQQSKAILNHDALEQFLRQELPKIGTSACPPYHLAIVIGGTSAEATLKMVKLAAARYIDSYLPHSGDESGRPFRDLALEAEVLALTRQLGIGAQFGGRYFAHDVRVVRLPRHGASCPIGIGLSCSADRHLTAYIDRNGIYLEQLERDPARFLPQTPLAESAVIDIDLNQPLADIRAQLSRHPVGTRLSLNGPLIVARDIAHAQLKAQLDSGEPLPDYLKQHPIYYAGPAKSPAGYPSGSFGPTTAGRMDSYIDLFQRHGAALITIAKGNRSLEVTRACHRYGGFYLGSIGGVGAQLSHDSIRAMTPIAFEELGMEAIFKLQVNNFPAFIIIDDKGNDFYATPHP